MLWVLLSVSALLQRFAIVALDADELGHQDLFQSVAMSMGCFGAGYVTGLLIWRPVPDDHLGGGLRGMLFPEH